MGARINHAAVAARHVEIVLESASSGLASANDSLAGAAIAQVHATLALVEQQRIANLIALAQLQQASMPVQGPAWFHLHNPQTDGGWYTVKPSVREGLGL